MVWLSGKEDHWLFVLIISKSSKNIAQLCDGTGGGLTSGQVSANSWDAKESSPLITTITRWEEGEGGNFTNVCAYT